MHLLCQCVLKGAYALNFGNGVLIGAYALIGSVCANRCLCTYWVSVC